MTDPRVDIIFSDIENENSAASELNAESTLLFAEYIVEHSPFATEEFSENNYVPREW